RRREPSGEQPDEPDALPAEAAYVSPEREGNQEDDEQRIDLVHGHPPGPTGAAGPGVERRGGLDRRAGGAAQGALAGRHRLLLPPDAWLLVMLPLAQLGENAGFLTLFLEATDRALDGLVVLDPNPCHALHSPPLRAPATATAARRWKSEKGTIKQKPWSVKVGSRISARPCPTGGRNVQESLREVGEDSVDARRHQAVEFGLRIHRPDAHGEPRRPRRGDRRGGGCLLAEMQGSRTDALRKADRVGHGIVLPEDGECRRGRVGSQPLEGSPR